MPEIVNITRPLAEFAVSSGGQHIFPASHWIDVQKIDQSGWRVAFCRSQRKHIGFEHPYAILFYGARNSLAGPG